MQIYEISEYFFVFKFFYLCEACFLIIFLYFCNKYSTTSIHNNEISHTQQSPLQPHIEC